MENINIKVILDEVFGKSCDSITCDTYEYKKIANLLINLLMILKIKVYLQTNILEV